MPNQVENHHRGLDIVANPVIADPIAPLGDLGCHELLSAMGIRLNPL